MPLDPNLVNLLVLLPYLVSGFMYLVTDPPATPIRPSDDRLRQVAKGLAQPVPAHESPAREDHTITGLLTLTIALQGLMSMQWPSDFLRIWAELRPMVILLMGLIWVIRKQKRKLIGSPLQSLVTQQVVSGFKFIRNHGSKDPSEKPLSPLSLDAGVPGITKLRTMALMVLGFYLAFRGQGEPTPIMGCLDENGRPQFLPSLEAGSGQARDPVPQVKVEKPEDVATESQSTEELVTVEQNLPEISRPENELTSTPTDDAPPTVPHAPTQEAPTYTLVGYTGPKTLDLTRSGIILIAMAMFDISSSTSALIFNDVLAASVPAHLITGLLAWKLSSLPKTGIPERRAIIRLGAVASILYGLGLGWSLGNFSGGSKSTIVLWNGLARFMHHAAQATELLKNGSETAIASFLNQTRNKEYAGMLNSSLTGEMYSALFGGNASEGW